MTAHESRQTRVNLAELERQGWVRQSVLSEPRLGEIVETYRSLGYEVLLIPVLVACAAERKAGACTSCFEGDPEPERYQVVYTRKRTGDAGTGHDTPC